jgi:hypothetical protein
MDQSNIDEFLFYNSWQKYIDIKKKHFIDNTQTKNIFNKSPDNEKFKTILQNIMNINLFDLSRILYIGVSFLDKFIKLNIFNILNKYTNCYGDFDISLATYTKHDIIIEKYLEILTDFTLQIEFTLNYHFLLLIYHLKKYTKHNKYNINKLQSSITYKYYRIVTELESNVQISSLLLLFLQVIVNTSNTFENYYSSNSEDDTIENYNYIKTQFDLSKEQNKINQLLDNFIISIIDSNDLSLFDSCINYIIDLMVICYKKFEKVFDLFINNILKKKFPDTNFTAIQTTIKFFIEKEIVTIIEKIEKLL